MIANTAFLAVVTGLLGLPQLWFGSEPLFEQWLHPVTHLAPFDPGGERAAMHSHVIEALGMLASVTIALAGWYVARTLYRDEAATAERVAALKARYAGWHRVLYHKYYVDEIYQATFVRGFNALSAACAWFDRNVVDGAVNGVGALVRSAGSRLRTLQTGYVRNYALGVALGAVLLVGYVLTRIDI